MAVFLTRLLVLVVFPRCSVIVPLLFLLYVYDLPAALGNSAFLCCRRCENGVSAFPIKQPSFLPFFHLGLGGETGSTNQPKKCSCHTVGNILALSPRQMPTTEFPRSLMSETWGFPLDTTSPRQCTSSKWLRIQQDDCFSWSAGLSRTYPKQRLTHCSVS